MVRTTIVEHQELTEFGYMPSNRQIITESCKCSFLEQELAKLKAENEKYKWALEKITDLHAEDGSIMQRYAYDALDK